MIQKFSLEIETGNAAMLTCYDISGALVKVADKIRHESTSNIRRMSPGKIMDINGNTVGFWKVE